MLTLLAAIAALGGPANAASPAAPSPRTIVITPATRMAGMACKPTGRYEIADRALLYRNDGEARMSPLSRLPKANLDKAVVRTVDGCDAPLVVGYQVGR